MMAFYYDRSCDRYSRVGGTYSTPITAYSCRGEQIDFTSSLILGDRTIWQGKQDPHSRNTSAGNPTPKLCVQQPTGNKRKGAAKTRSPKPVGQASQIKSLAPFGTRAASWSF